MRLFFLVLQAVALDIAPDLLGHFRTRHVPAPTTAPSVALGVIGFMKAAFGLRFAFLAFFFAIYFSPLKRSA